MECKIVRSTNRSKVIMFSNWNMFYVLVAISELVVLASFAKILINDYITTWSK